jgi:hypothetical protein
MEVSNAEKYYQNQLRRMREYYERNKDTINQKRKEKRLQTNPDIKQRVRKLKDQTKE